MTAADPMIAELIREVLAEELARLRGGVPSIGRAREAGVHEERVHIAGDADLAAFARRVLAVAGDREARDAFEKGRLVFRLEAGAGTAGVGVAGGAGTTGSIGRAESIGAMGGAGRAGGSTEATGGGGRAGRNGSAQGGGCDAGGSRSHGSGAAAAGVDPPASATPSRAGAGHTEVIERGLLSERHAERLPRGTVRVRLGRNVRMTPLARDRLRRRGIAIERTER